MPMPEIEDYTISELQDRGDGFKDFDLNIGEVERLMNDCYAAGKADALPDMPITGSTWRHKQIPLMVIYEGPEDGWFELPRIKPPGFEPVPQHLIQRAYDTGGLEEVK